MIEDILKGDLFESKAQTLVNTVNTVGVMGKGVALGFKQRFPEMNKDYIARCDEGSVRLGQPYLWKQMVGQWVVNFPTKEHWRSVSKLSDITSGLEYLAHHVIDWEIESLAVPPLGCGQGQLDWAVVGPTLYQHLDALPIPVYLFAPWEVPEGQLSIEYLAQAEVIDSETRVEVEPAWAAYAHIANEVNKQPYAWPVGKTRFQKLVYLATVAGVPSDLEFVEGSCGPFAEGLTRILSRLVNNGVVELRAEGQLMRVTEGPTLSTAEDRFADYLAEHGEAIHRTIDLMSRLNGRRTEIAATVIFVTRSLQTRLDRQPTQQEVVDEASRWKARRKPSISKHEFESTVQDLTGLGWIDVEIDEDDYHELLTIA